MRLHRRPELREPPQYRRVAEESDRERPVSRPAHGRRRPRDLRIRRTHGLEPRLSQTGHGRPDPARQRPGRDPRRRPQAREGRRRMGQDLPERRRRQPACRPPQPVHDARGARRRRRRSPQLQAEGHRPLPRDPRHQERPPRRLRRDRARDLHRFGDARPAAETQRSRRPRPILRESEHRTRKGLRHAPGGHRRPHRNARGRGRERAEDPEGRRPPRHGRRLRIRLDAPRRLREGAFVLRERDRLLRDRHAALRDEDRRRDPRPREGARHAAARQAGRRPRGRRRPDQEHQDPRGPQPLHRGDAGRNRQGGPACPEPRRRARMIALLLLLADVYHVSLSGNDANDGKSPAKAWKTVAKVNATAFSPGDQILFARGGEWREGLKAGSSGAPGKPIVYGAYGTGAKPKFWGSDVVTVGADGSTQVATPVAALLADHQFLLPGTWSWAGGVLKAKPGTYTACVRVDPVHSNGKNHLVFRDLVADESADARDGYGFRVMGSDAVRLEDCEAYRAGRHHFGTINSSNFVGLRLKCALAMPNCPGGATFYVSFSDPSRKSDSHQWIDCSAERFENPGQRNYQIFYDHGEGLGPILIQNMTSKGGRMSIGSSSTAPITIKGGLIEDATLEIFGDHVRVD